jgi:hypothetical protein
VTCEECGAEFTPRPCNAAKQRFCQANCKKRAWGREEYANNPEFREQCLDLNREYHENLTSVALARRQLQMRRAKGRLRIRKSLRALS